MMPLYARLRPVGVWSSALFIVNNKISWGKLRSMSTSYQCITALTMEIMKPVMNEKNRREGGRVMKREDLNKFVDLYQNLSDDQKGNTLLFLGQNYGSNQRAIFDQCALVSELSESKRESQTLWNAEQKLSSLLNPVYHTLFTQIGTVNNGVKFLVDLRRDALQYAKNNEMPRRDLQILKQLSAHIGGILSMWFSAGLLQLRRITWDTSAEILEKLASYEAVHSIKNWLDLKHRLGPERRCFAFFHMAMSNEPLIVLHIALTRLISDNMTEILDYRSEKQHGNCTNPECAIFYSITSTQHGLYGIELGAYLIQSVLNSLKQELPQLTTFSSLSPIPGFRNWLMREPDESILGYLGPEDIRLLSQAKKIVGTDEDVIFLKELTKNLEHFRNSDVVTLVKEPLTKLCAIYLCLIKRRGYALDPVANFHLKNGAVVWRINWMADKSVSGMLQSFGLMVNYRYYLKKMAENSVDYIANQKIQISACVSDLLYNSKTRSLL